MNADSIGMACLRIKRAKHLVHSGCAPMKRVTRRHARRVMRLMLHVNVAPGTKVAGLKQDGDLWHLDPFPKKAAGLRLDFLGDEPCDLA